MAVGGLGRAAAARAARVGAAGVGRQVGDREEEGLGRRRAAVDVVDRLAGVEVALVGLRAGLGARAGALHGAGRVAVAAQCPVLVQAEVAEVVGGGVDRAVPLLPAGGHLARVAPCRSRSGTCRCARSRTRRRAARPAACWTSRACRSRRRAASCPARRGSGVLAGEVGAARRAAQREGGEVAREGRALAADQAPHAGQGAHLLLGLVVGHDDHHFGLALDCAGAGWSEATSATAAEHEPGEQREGCELDAHCPSNTGGRWRVAASGR